ncbi:MAG: hypothetical protein HEP71_25915 [Roseivirga sp.]|nr:hypothetical protein [Roseivirga sp.]
MAIYQTNYFKKVIITEWRQLTWDDFQGKVNPFTEYAAVIYSDIYLEPTPNTGYRAYAGQDNQQSWTTLDSTEVYALNHEQYHFNITEVFARKMNQFIRKNPGMGFSAYKKQMAIFRRQERQMQARYDLESGHSINISKQWLWEYKIDSMLLANSDQPRTYTEQYSGASIYFPSEPDNRIEIGQKNSTLSLGLELKKYGMIMTLFSLQSSITDRQGFVEYLTSINSTGSKSILHFDQNEKGTFWTVYDSESRNVTFESLSFTPEYSYRGVARFNGHLQDSLQFASIAQTYISSFNVINTSDYWSNRAKISVKTKTGQVEPTVEEYDCLVVEPDQSVGFYAKPIFTQNDSLLIPFKALAHPDGLIKGFLFIVDDEAFYSYTQSSEHIFKLPLSDLPKTIFQARIGYLVNGDSLTECYQFHNQSMVVYPD